MTGVVTLPAGAALFTASAPFALDGGGTLEDLQVGFELIGPADAPVVAVLGGISAHCHVAAHAARPAPGWWEALVGPGRALDTRRARVLSCDWLGGCGATSGAALTAVGSRDQARMLLLLLDHLRIPRLHALVGASFGGMVGLHCAALAPARVGQLLLLGAAHRTHPLASGWRAVQRGILALGQRAGAERDALVLARALAMTTYRSAVEFAQRFAAGAAATAWLFRQGEAFADRFTAAAFARLSQAIDDHRIDPGTVPVPTTAVSFDTDQLVPPWLVAELCAQLRGPARHVALASPFGHDAFLKEVAALAPLVAAVVPEVRS